MQSTVDSPAKRRGPVAGLAFTLFAILAAISIFAVRDRLISIGRENPNAEAPRPAGTPYTYQQFLWQAGARTNTLDLFEPNDGRLIQSFDLQEVGRGLAPRNVAIGLEHVLLMSRGEGALFRHDGSFIQSFSHDLGQIKSSCPTTVPDEMIVCRQARNILYRVRLERLRESGSLSLEQDVVWWTTTLENFSGDAHGNGQDTDCKGVNPRGIVQARLDASKPHLDGAIWVACKGRGHVERPDNPNASAQVIRFDFATGKPTFRCDVPFGARGICVDPHHPDHDEIWLTCLGDKEPGSGHELVRIIDDGAPGSPRVERVPLGNAEPRGAFGIASTMDGFKYVACSTSDEIWKVGPDGKPIQNDRWPVDVSVATAPGGEPLQGPISVGIDRNDKIWVAFKNYDRIVRLHPDGTVEIDNRAARGGTPGRPEMLGDFTGYWTAHALAPAGPRRRPRRRT